MWRNLLKSGLRTGMVVVLAPKIKPHFDRAVDTARDAAKAVVDKVASR